MAVDNLTLAGTPRKQARFGEPLKFFQNVVLTYSGDECLIWPFARRADGYGSLYHEGKTRIVSRLACQEINGPPPADGYDAAHSCGKGHLGCCTLKHLSWKTRKENFGDKIIHGTLLKGEQLPQSKLTEAAVAYIRNMKGVVPQSRLAAAYGVHPSLISRVQAFKIWR